MRVEVPYCNQIPLGDFKLIYNLFIDYKGGHLCSHLKIRTLIDK
jgi:hypothetical protein